MSFLDRMSITGVRSFSPEQDQVITFSSPLTLILGPNGTGKTTIIESLRYLTTGDYPPNSERGQAFVHDPKLAGEREVKGKVKLRFSDTTGHKVVTTRVMEGQQKLKRLQVKSLDGTIVRQNEQGEKTSMSSKCSELDREMVSLFGVSKAILNNVIFCHQEESNWPLGEGKSLKDKFDDIFAATGYVKALENLHNMKNKLIADAKLLNNDLKHVEECKTQAAKMKADLEKSETRLGISRNKIEKLRNDLEPINKSLDGIREKEHVISKLNEELIQKQTQFDLVKKACEELKLQIQNEFSGSVDDLKVEIHNFESELDDKKLRKNDIEKHIKRLEEEINGHSANRSEILIKVGSLESEAKKHRENIVARDKAARALHSEFKLSVIISGTGDLSTSEFDEINRQISEKLLMLAKEAEDLKISFSKLENEFQSQLDSLNESKSRLSQTKDIRKNQMSNNDKEVREINSKLLKVKSSVDKLAQVEKAHQEKKSELSTASTVLDEEALNKEIEDKETNIQKFEKRIRSLDDEMLKLNEQTGFRAELDVLQKDKKSKEDAIKKLKSKHEDTLIRILHRVPNENIRAEVEKYFTKLKREISTAQENRSQLQVELAMLETNRKTAKEELSKKEKELQDFEDQMFQVNGSRDLETSIIQLETQIKTLQDEKGSFIGAQYLYNSFIEKLSRTDPCCPLCHREFNEPQDVEELIVDLNMSLTTMPKELDSKQNTIDDNQRKFNRLSEMRPVKTQIEKLLNEIPRMKSNLKSFESQIEKCRNNLSDLDNELTIKKTDEFAVTSMTKDLVLLEQNSLELRKTEKQLDETNRKLGIVVSDRNVSIVNEEKTEIQSQLAVLRSSLQEQQRSLKDYTFRKNQLQKQVNELGAQLVQISKDAQATTELQNRKQQLLAEIANCKSEISDIEKQLSPIQLQIGEVTTKKTTASKENENTLDKLRRQQQELKRKIDNITAYQSHIIKYTSANTEAMLKICLDKSEKIQNLIQKSSDLKQQLNNDWQSLSKEIDNNQTRLRELTDCQTLKTKEEQLRLLSRSINDLKARVGGYDERSLIKEKNQLLTKGNRINTEINQEEGRHTQLEDDIKRQKNELQADIFRDVEKKYTEKFVDLKTTQVTSKDLHKYYIALDGAIMKYHAMKMEEINKIIRDLWGRIYKGNDIDYIEIRSEVGESRSATSRRQYNYKVVMVKGNVDQVMRGRCSAGQKVLASLIIRLALAETFCVNCGILALDEPTTNLDYENIQSLSKALAEIVELRSAERQFQLIVISHDEEFVSSLGHVSSVDFCNKLEKNYAGHSTISRCYMQQSQLE